MGKLSGLAAKSGSGFFMLKFKMACKMAAKSDLIIFHIKSGKISIKCFFFIISH